VARVTLEGSINGFPFSISRTKTASKGDLVFHHDGKDLTTQSVKETQLMIDEKLGVGSQILARTMFHGQHAMNDLLESTDAKFKEELSLLVPLELWQKATSLARKKSRDAKTSASELNGMIKMRAEDVDKLRGRTDQAGQKLQEKKAALENLEEQYELLMASAGTEKASEVELIDLEEQLRTASSAVKTLDERYRSLITKRDSELKPLQSSLSEFNDSLGSVTEECQLKERELFAATMSFDAAKETVKQVERKWSIDLSQGMPVELVSPETCPTCFQPVTQESSSGDHSHANLQEILEEEISNGLAALESGEASLETCAKELQESNESRLSRETMKNDLLEDFERVALGWDTQIKQVDEDLSTRRQDFAHLSEQLSSIAKNSQVLAKQDAVKATVESSAAAVEFANEVYTSLCHEIEEGEKRLDSLETEKEEHTTTGRIMSDLGERFGQRGVQAFLLQTVVGSLETISQVYLNDLSDGAQRLSLSLDAGDRISRIGSVIGSDGAFKERPLSTLSGGQWRRCSLALTFAFAELVARRGKLRPSICVLDEPLTHLDRSGRAKVGEVIRGMLRPPDSAEFRGFGGLGMTTVLIILQDLAAEELDEAFDCIDEVVKEKSSSYVKVDELT
jgi:DNA repair exonuclease SbcCD ATPase subunit